MKFLSGLVIRALITLKTDAKSVYAMKETLAWTPPPVGKAMAQNP